MDRAISLGLTAVFAVLALVSLFHGLTEDWHSLPVSGICVVMAVVAAMIWKDCEEN